MQITRLNSSASAMIRTKRGCPFQNELPQLILRRVRKSSPTPQSANQRAQAMFWWLALLAATLPIAYRQVTVSDAWWHAALGKWMV